MRQYMYFTVIKYVGGRVKVMIGKVDVRDTLDGEKVEDVIHIRALKPYDPAHAYEAWRRTLKEMGINAEDLSTIYRALRQQLADKRPDEQEATAGYVWW